jgi:hypothetical protein
VLTWRHMAAVRRDLEQIVNLLTGPIFADALGKPLALGSAVNRRKPSVRGASLSAGDRVAAGE